MLIHVYGTSWADWHQALEETELWTQIPEVCKVIHTSAGNVPVENSCPCGEGATLIPLFKGDVEEEFEGFRTLIPTKKQRILFNDKASFYDFMFQNNLTSFIPRTMGLNFDPPTIPCVIKRRDLAGGLGVAVIKDLESLERAFQSEYFKDKPFLIQEYIQGHTEYVTHVVCKEGVFLWAATLEGPTPQEAGINRGPFAESVAGVDDQHLEVFRKIFEASKFSGPACINFKIVEGKPVIFEINPRFGGSLFRPKFRTQLLECIRTLVQHASATITRTHDS